MAMEVLDLDRDLVDVGLTLRDVREIVAGGVPGDVTGFGSRDTMLVVTGDGGVDWFRGR